MYTQNIPCVDLSIVGLAPCESGLPARIADGLPELLELLAVRQDEIFEDRGYYASCHSICATKGGPDGIPPGETESLQFVLETIGTLCYLEVRTFCMNEVNTEHIRHWYTLVINWVTDGQEYTQEFFLDGTPVTEAVAVIPFEPVAA